MTNTHDYTRRFWGHDYTIHDVIDDGQILHVSGWGYGLCDGDFIVLKNGERGSRYKIHTVTYHLDPNDMWNATLEFAPRTHPSPPSQSDQ